MAQFLLTEIARKIEAYRNRLRRETGENRNLLLRERARRRQVVGLVLLVIVLFQLLQLPGAIMMQRIEAIGTIVLGLGVCALAMLLNQLGRATLVTVLLIIVVDLNCVLLLLTSPIGLDVRSLPIFDILVLSELIAVSLLPPGSVFLVAASNIAFMLASILLLPATLDLKLLLHSSMGYSVVMQPISLQIAVALIAYIWARSSLNMLMHAGQADAMAGLERREAERRLDLEQGIDYLTRVLEQALSGNREVWVYLSQDHPLWRLGNAINLLLGQLRRAAMVEGENQRLRVEIRRLNEALRVARRLS